MSRTADLERAHAAALSAKATRNQLQREHDKAHRVVVAKAGELAAAEEAYERAEAEAKRLERETAVERPLKAVA